MPHTPKILIVEDDHAIRQLYELKFGLADYRVKTAADGGEGFELAQTFLPDILLLDIKMPVMNGDELLAKLRAEAWGQAIRVIVLTNISRDEAPPVFQFLNVDRYIVKAHHTPAQVLETVREILR